MKPKNQNYKEKIKNRKYKGLYKERNNNNHNVSWAAYYYDFWRSCDSEDCSNDAENTEINKFDTYSQLF